MNEEVRIAIFCRGSCQRYVRVRRVVGGFRCGECGGNAFGLAVVPDRLPSEEGRAAAAASPYMLREVAD